jgi:hypothetical protein
MAGIVALGAPQKGDEIARRRESEPEHFRTLGRIDELINVVRVEAALQAQMSGARNARKRFPSAIGERPISSRHRNGCIALVHLHR